MSLSLFARKTVICWWLVVASPAVVFGQTSFTPVGGEYPIAGALPGDQVFPAAAIGPAGGILVWQDNSVVKTGMRIRAARLDGSLTVISNFLASSVAKAATTGDQEKPQVAMLNSGGAVVVWQGGKHGLQKIYARFIGPDGKFLVKQDVRVSAHPKYNQINPQVATLTNGTVVIVWASDGQDGSMQGVFARLFSPAGKALGAEFQVNQYTLNNQRTPALAALANGNFVVAWVSELQRSSTAIDVYARLFTGSGVPVADEFPVNTTTTNTCANPSVAGSPLGGFAAAWSQNDNPTLPAVPIYSQATISSTNLASVGASTNGWDVFGRFFDATGAPTTAPFRLNQYTYGDQFGPRISALGTNYMAVWTSLGQPDPDTGVVDPWEGVFGQFITGSGSLVFTNDVHVNTTVAGRQVQPVVTSDGASRFLVLWSSSVLSVGRFDADIFAQQYLQSGGQ
ncbi:MAG: hypothetical protein ABSA69_10820 [Verrucomicrobiota bacterium]|jgi:hypothetical protein